MQLTTRITIACMWHTTESYYWFELEMWKGSPRAGVWEANRFKDLADGCIWSAVMSTYLKQMLKAMGCASIVIRVDSWIVYSKGLFSSAAGLLTMEPKFWHQGFLQGGFGVVEGGPRVSFWTYPPFSLSLYMLRWTSNPPPSLHIHPSHSPNPLFP